jgi:oxaloacetate decarboxylase gamma subunit
MNSLQPLIIESAQLLIIGMCTVFLILTMLIFLINLVSKVISKFNLVDPPAPVRKAKTARKNTDATPNNNELIAVISTAITAHKKRHPI